MNDEVSRRRLLRLSDDLEYVAGLNGVNEVHVGRVSCRPALCLDRGGWDAIAAYQFSQRIISGDPGDLTAGSYYPVDPYYARRGGPPRAWPNEEGTAAVTWRGGSGAVPHVTGWFETLFSLLLGQEGIPEWAAAASFDALIENILNLLPTTSVRGSLRSKSIAMNEFLDTPRCLRWAPDETMVCLYEAPAVTVGEAVVDLLLGNAQHPIDLAREGQRLAEEFSLTRPLSDAQVAWVVLLRRAGGEFRKFEELQQHCDLLISEHQTRLKKKLPPPLLKRIESRRGTGSRWVAE